MDMRCAWCQKSLAGLRRDAKFCSKRCRQASHRFNAGARTIATRRPVEVGRTRRFGYADPPYPGRSGYYRHHPDYGGEVDHRELIAALTDGFPDGWALSTSAHALQDVLSWCPRTVRIAAWVRGPRPTASKVPLTTWEPVIVHGGRPQLRPAIDPRLDSLVHGVTARTTDPNRVTGAKPAAFCYWLFDLLGAQPGDELVDLYPGSGGVSRAWTAVNDASPPGPHDTSTVVAHDR
jgi:hypothetical protein